MPQRVPSYCPHCGSYNPDDLSLDHHRDWTTHSSDMAGCPKVVIKYCPPCFKYSDDVRSSMRLGISLYRFLNFSDEGDDLYRQRVRERIEKYREKQKMLEQIEEEENDNFAKAQKRHWWSRWN